MAEGDLQELDLLLEQLCEELLEERAEKRLVELLDESEVCRRRYLDTLELHAALWTAGGAGAATSQVLPAVGRTGTGSPNPERSIPGAPVLSPEPLIPPIALDLSSTLPQTPGLLAPGGWLFSYAAATVITGAMLLVFWVWTVSHEREVATSPPASTPPALKREKPMAFVGWITGSAACHWADPQDAPSVIVPLGRKYELAAGLLEISYQSGATVILQGPCAYEVDSPAGGFLSLGKLTARIEKPSAVNYQLSAAENPKSQIPNS